MVGRDPFQHKSLLGEDPSEGYPPGGMWVEDVYCDDNVVEDIPTDISCQNLDADNVGFGEQQPPLHEIKRHMLEALGRGMHCTKRPKPKDAYMWRMKKTWILKINWRICTWKPLLQCTRVQNECCVNYNHHHEHVFGVPCEQYIY